MKNASVGPYLKEYAEGYIRSGIFRQYPEAKILTGYMKQHFAGAEQVLDLGFGTGLWFWASFLPSLKRIDGFDLFPEALEQADRVLAHDDVPDAFRQAHAYIGETFELGDLRRLGEKRGNLVIQDYRDPWPEAIQRSRYDLITEHGGGLGELRSDEEFVDIVQRCGRVLKASGCMLFVNFTMKEHSRFERYLRGDEVWTVNLREELFLRAAKEAGMNMVDLHTVREPADMPGVQTFFYGYAQKPG